LSTVCGAFFYFYFYYYFFLFWFSHFFFPTSLSTWHGRIAALGLTNHRETTVAWSRATGEPLCNAVVWLDARTESTVTDLVARAPGGSADAFRARCGLPLASYFSAVKMRWLLDNDDAVAAAARSGDLMFGTVDAWFMYRTLGVHVTDVTNASRTMLMSLENLDWDDSMLAFFGVERRWLPEIKSSAEIYGTLGGRDVGADGEAAAASSSSGASAEPKPSSGPSTETPPSADTSSPSPRDGDGWGPLAGVPIAGCLGDQQAALVGQMCFAPGMAKSTYGTGAFLLSNTGTECVTSTSGLLTTVAYQFGAKAAPVYALEGSIAVAGAAVTWLRDGLGVIERASDLDAACNSVEDAGGVCFVPAFSGLLAPHWDGTARGTILGISQHTTRAHICRATVDAVAFQTREVLDCMREDAGEDSNDGKESTTSSPQLPALSIDGGMTASDHLCRTLADICARPVVRSSMAEATALGAAYAAGLATGVFASTQDIVGCAERSLETFDPTPGTTARTDRALRRWRRAVERSKRWAIDTDDEDE
jgi:glycerol kinase